MKYCLIVVMAIVLSCNSQKNDAIEKTISLAMCKKADIDSTRKYLEFDLLKIYPAKLDCSHINKYATLYIAKQDNGDSLYIFDLCGKVSDYAYDTTGKYVPTVYTNEILNNPPGKVVVFVPNNFILPKGAQYVFAPLSIDVEK